MSHPEPDIFNPERAHITAVQRRRCDLNVIKDLRGHVVVDRGGILCEVNMSQQSQRGVVAFRAREGRRVDSCLQFHGPFREGDEWELELLADDTEEGEGGDGAGVGDVKIG